MNSTSKKALIVCNGEAPSLQLLDTFWDKVDLRIAADGGANFLYAHKKIPDVIVGDMDSLNKSIKRELEASGYKLLVPVSEQQSNDADKAVRHCIQEQITEIHLLGASGKRQDHFLANLDVLYKYSSQIKILLWTEEECMEVIQSFWAGELKVGCRLSLIPVFGAAHGISTQGLDFSLNDESLIPGKAPSGVSNRVNNAVQIKVRQGALLLIIESPLTV